MPGEQLRQERRSGHPAGADECPLRTVRTPLGLRQLLPRRVEFGLQCAQQAHAVVDLPVVLVFLVLRQFHARLEVEFVRGEHEARAALGKQLLPPAVRDFDHRAGLVAGVGVQRMQALAVPGQAHRNQRQRQRAGDVRQGLDGLLQRGAVVDAGTEHRLGVELHAAVGEPMELIQQPPSTLLAQDVAAQLGVDRVHGDVQWRRVARDHPVQFAVGDVGQGHVVAHHQAHAPVIVLDAHAGPHVFGQLIHEAEQAPVAAQPHAAHHGLFKLQAQGIVLALADAEVFHLSLPADNQLHAALSGQRLVIQKVDHRLAADGEQLVAGAQACARGGTAGIDGGNFLCHATSENM